MNEQLKDIHRRAFEIKVEVMEGGKLPFKAHLTDAGFDVFATYDFTIQPGEVIKHPLNIKMHLPRGTYASIESKSGLGAKGLLVYAGVIDEGYRGVPHVVGAHIYQTGMPIKIKKGDKLAQFIVYPFNAQYYIEQVDHVDDGTERGGGGFGSTGN